MSIINFLLQLHAMNLRRKILEHRKNNQETSTQDIAKRNQQLIEESRRRVNSLYSNPFGKSGGVFGDDS